MAFRNASYYDHRSILTCVLDPENGLTYYTYDAASRMTSVKDPWGEVTYYDYSLGGRTTKAVKYGTICGITSGGRPDYTGDAWFTPLSGADCGARKGGRFRWRLCKG
jgi:YD repeat-containing protein